MNFVSINTYMIYVYVLAYSQMKVNPTSDIEPELGLYYLVSTCSSQLQRCCTFPAGDMEEDETPAPLGFKVETADFPGHS